jgi:hypothetical protein
MAIFPKIFPKWFQRHTREADRPKNDLKLLKLLERVKGIEPSSSAWKADACA